MKKMASAMLGDQRWKYPALLHCTDIRRLGSKLVYNRRLTYLKVPSKLRRKSLRGDVSPSTFKSQMLLLVTNNSSCCFLHDQRAYTMMMMMRHDASRGKVPCGRHKRARQHHRHHRPSPGSIAHTPRITYGGILMTT